MFGIVASWIVKTDFALSFDLRDIVLYLVKAYMRSKLNRKIQMRKTYRFRSGFCVIPNK